MKLGSMSGNCYTMAFVAKLFFEGAVYVPSGRSEEERRGFSLSALSSHLAGERGQPLEVKDFESLFDLSYDPDFGESEAFDYIRKSRGISVASSDEAAGLTGRQKMIVQLVQFISTVHYLHYLQYQVGSFIEPVIRSELGGGTVMPQVTLEQIESMRSQLQKGRTCLLLLLEAKQVYGHVVLAYGLQSSASAHYLFVYDSNIQYGSEKRHSVIKVSKDGRVLGMFLVNDRKGLVADSIYDDDSWFSKEASFGLVHLPDSPLQKRNMQELARKAGHADAETAYLVAGGQFLHDLTKQSPEKSSLRQDTLAFVRNIQSIQTSLGQTNIPKEDELSEDATVEQLNQFLKKHADLGIRTAYPFALPRGLSITDTSIEFHARDANRAVVKSTLTLAKDGPVDVIVAAIQKGAALADSEQIATWLKSVRTRIGPTKIQAVVQLAVRKGKMPSGFGSQHSRTTYGPVPVLQKSHLIVGDLVPDRKANVDHQLEISEAALQGGLAAALDKAGLVGHKFWFTYTLIPETWVSDAVERKGYVRLDGAKLDLLGAGGSHSVGRIRLNLQGYSFVRANPFNNRTGVSIDAKSVDVDVKVYSRKELGASEWYVYGDVDGDIDADDGLANVVVSLATLVVDEVFPYVQGLLNDYIRDQLNVYVKLKKQIGVHDASVTTTSLEVNSGEAIVDVDDLTKRLFGVQVPVRMRFWTVKNDRIVIGASYK